MVAVRWATAWVLQAAGCAELMGVEAGSLHNLTSGLSQEVVQSLIKQAGSSGDERVVTWNQMWLQILILLVIRP